MQVQNKAVFTTIQAKAVFLLIILKVVAILFGISEPDISAVVMKMEISPTNILKKERILKT
ncbi:hypothetical protein D3C80_1638810 [compost metagenome]